MKINDLKKQKNVEVLNASSQKKLKGGSNKRTNSTKMDCPPPILGVKQSKVE